VFEKGARPYLETNGLIFRFDGKNREKRKRILRVGGCFGFIIGRYVTKRRDSRLYGEIV